MTRHVREHTHTRAHTPTVTQPTTSAAAAAAALTRAKSRKKARASGRLLSGWPHRQVTRNGDGRMKCQRGHAPHRRQHVGVCLGWHPVAVSGWVLYAADGRRRSRHSVGSSVRNCLPRNCKTSHGPKGRCMAAAVVWTRMQKLPLQFSRQKFCSVLLLTLERML
jgi:hypothetical protein